MTRKVFELEGNIIHIIVDDECEYYIPVSNISHLSRGKTKVEERIHLFFGSGREVIIFYGGVEDSRQDLAFLLQVMNSKIND
jgi:hypothetical protein